MFTGHRKCVNYEEFEQSEKTRYCRPADDSIQNTDRFSVGQRIQGPTERQTERKEYYEFSGHKGNASGGSST